MIIVTFLGNPGKKYSKNRHNIGFIIGEYFTSAHSVKMNQKLKSSINGRGSVDGVEFIASAPQTFMNSSGVAVKELLKYYKAEPDKLIVVHDDIELSFPEYKTKFGGGHKGQNGIRSIIQNIETPDFHRLRFGVGRPDIPDIPIADYVLSDFTKEERDKITELLPQIDEEICSLIKKVEVLE